MKKSFVIILLVIFLSMPMISFASAPTGCERMFQRCYFDNILTGNLWACGVGYAFCIAFVE